MIWQLIQMMAGTIRDFVAARKVRRATRPYFMFQRSKVWRRADKRFGMRIVFKNVGQHPAEKLSLTVGLVNCRLDRPALYEWQANAPQVSSGGKFQWEEQAVSLVPEMPWHNVYADVRYKDPMTTEAYSQFFVRLWRAVPGGEPSAAFKAVSEREAAKVRGFVKGTA